MLQYLLPYVQGFSIRSFGSWGEASRHTWKIAEFPSFSIRSFGSWGEAGSLVSIIAFR